MQLLDASLAFVLTMAALATVVTVIMEAGLRVARIRKKNFIVILSMITEEIRTRDLGLDDTQIWDFLVRVLKNPSEPTAEKLKARCRKIAGIQERLTYLGPDRFAGKGWFRQGLTFIRQIFGDPKRANLNDNASLEFLLRSLTESPAIRDAVARKADALTLAFNRIARKYEDMGAAVSASFKRQAQSWSMIIGIGLAVACNINAMTIFNSFLIDPALANAVIAAHEAQEAARETAPNQGDAQKGETRDTGQENPGAITQLVQLKQMGIPLGWRSCPDNICPWPIDIDDLENLKNFFTWLIQTGLTGILIGLGAPFWFDVAKRMSQIRKGIQSEAASGEYRLSQSNANGDAAQRREIVKRVLADAAQEADLLKPNSFLDKGAGFQ